MNRAALCAILALAGLARAESFTQPGTVGLLLDRAVLTNAVDAEVRVGSGSIVARYGVRRTGSAERFSAMTATTLTFRFLRGPVRWEVTLTREPSAQALAVRGVP